MQFEIEEFIFNLSTSNIEEQSILLKTRGHHNALSLSRRDWKKCSLRWYGLGPSPPSGARAGTVPPVGK